MTAIELKEKILEKLNSLLGVYNNGTKSIYIYGASSNPPSKSSGLECLILEMPASISRKTSGGGHYKPQEWQITLKNYAKSKNLIDAYQILERLFVVTKLSYMPASSDLIEQCNFSILDPTII